MGKKIVEISRQLGKVLHDNNLVVVTAESCTGGGVAQAITDIPGSSTWFDRGFVTYSNKAKIQMLQVKQSTLNEYGAVSKQVAIEMVHGALTNSMADLAISITGIAGPDGGTEHKPVGTVYIAWGVKKGGGVSCKGYLFLGSRTEVREQTVYSALKESILMIS